MKRACFVIIAVFLYYFLPAQKVYFVYLQSENQQRFFVRIDEKIFNSSESGYLILSNLKNGSYPLRIGLPGKDVPDLVYTIDVDNKDQGYLLKDFGEKGWGLFSWQTMQVLMPETGKVEENMVKMEPREVSSFTKLLAKAADDSTLMEKPVVVSAVEDKPVLVQEKKATGEEKPSDSVSMAMQPVDLPEKKDPEPAVNSGNPVTTESLKNKEIATNNDSVSRDASLSKQEEFLPETDSSAASVNISKEDTSEVLKNAVEQQAPPVKLPVGIEGTYKKSTVKLHSESSTTEGIGLVFNDIYPDGTTETIRIMIPVKPGSIVEKEETKENAAKMISQDSVEKKTGAMQPVKVNECAAIAGEEDFFRLRRKMAAETSDENMIDQARKDFKTRCYSTEQIRNLAALFLNDSGKYHFFDEAYNHVSDPVHFGELASALKDDYYINRFKAMLR